MGKRETDVNPMKDLHSDFPIVCLGDPALRREAEEVKELDEGVRELAHQMFTAMYREGGQGLAAPQLGISRRIAVVEVPPGSGERYVLVNPRALAVSEERVRGVEGCLSIPGVQDVVERPAEILIEATDPEGRYLRLEAGGDLARCFQHEMDHLDGVLYIDHLSPLARQILLKRYHKLRT